MPLRIVRTPDDPDRMLATEYEPPPRPIRRPNPIRPLGGGRSPRIQMDAAYVVGLDLGQANDFSSLTVVCRQGSAVHVPFAARTRYRAYPEIVESVAAILSRPPLANDYTLVLDGTGVGRPVLDLFRQAGILPISVTITGAGKVSGSLRALRVPKRDLLSSVLVTLQQERLKIAESLPLTPVLVDELTAMRLRLSHSGHDSYEPNRANSHDDLVISLAMALWWAEKAAGRGVQAEPVAPQPEPERPGAVRRPVAWPEFERWVRDGD